MICLNPLVIPLITADWYGATYNGFLFKDLTLKTLQAMLLNAICHSEGMLPAVTSEETSLHLLMMFVPTITGHLAVNSVSGTTNTGAKNYEGNTN